MVFKVQLKLKYGLHGMHLVMRRGGEFFVVVGGSVDCWCCVNVDVPILGDKYLYFNLLNFYLHITGVPKRTSLIILLYSSINLE